MDPDKLEQAARTIWTLWRSGTVVDSLAADQCPRSEREGYAIQSALPAIAHDSVSGWKIAATAAAGQAHLAVDGPIAGRLLASRSHRSGATVGIGANRFLVAEAEFAFVLGDDLTPRETPYDRDEVLAAVATLHPAIELPDSRFADPTIAGKAQLAADNACADHFVLGEAAPEGWRALDLASHGVTLLIDEQPATHGHGRDVLGDPRDALAWLANAHRLTGAGLERGQVITTGVCGLPTPYRPGNQITADFGVLGRAEVRIAA